MDRNETAQRIKSLLNDVVEEIDAYYDDNIPQGLQEEQPKEWQKLIDEMNNAKDLVESLQHFIDNNV